MPMTNDGHDLGDDGAPGSSLYGLQAWLGRWGHVLMVTFTAMVLAGIGLSLGLGQAYSDKPAIADLFPLQNVTSAAPMVQELTRQNGGRWPFDCLSPPPGKSVAVDPAASGASAAQPASPASAPPAPVATKTCKELATAKTVGAAASAPSVSVNLTPVRLLLGVDSLLIVPGYLGWFMLCFAFLLPRHRARRARVRSTAFDWHELLLQLCCLVPAAGAAFDLAENGITVLGIEDAISYVLSDDLVADMHLATTLKWWLFGASSLMVSAGAAWAIFTARHQRDGSDAEMPAGAASGTPWPRMSRVCVVVAALLGPVDALLLSGTSWAALAAFAAMSGAFVQWMCIGFLLWHHRFPRR
jgi:hypothetical protein